MIAEQGCMSITGHNYYIIYYIIIYILWLCHCKQTIMKVTLLLTTLVHDGIEGDSVGDVHLEQVHGLPVIIVQTAVPMLMASHISMGTDVH